jgi:hypothetical protein
MTQEELDALMNGDTDGIDDIEEEETAQNDDSSDRTVPDGYNDETSHQWPLPATDENKMVHQLDDVTKESEEKASEIFDIIEEISNSLMEKEDNATNVVDVLNSNIELFTTLSKKFPDVKAFKEQLEKNESALTDANEVLEALQASGDAIMSVMDIMQYQDIHRQKN